MYRPIVVTVDEAGEENIVMVDTKAAAGYPTRFLEPEYYKELPAFKLPGSDYRNGTFRCFQVEGDSMTDSLQNGDFVVADFATIILKISAKDIYMLLLQMIMSS